MPKHEKKYSQVNIKVEPATLEELRLLAKRQERTLSQQIRYLLTTCLKNADKVPALNR